MGNPMELTKMDPLSSPDLLFPMPDRAAPLCHITPNDVKLLCDQMRKVTMRINLYQLGKP